MKYPAGLKEGMVAFQWGHHARWSVSSPYLLIHLLSSWYMPGMVLSQVLERKKKGHELVNSLLSWSLPSSFLFHFIGKESKA